MTRFLADENVPGAVVNGLRSIGHDVMAVVEIAPGLPDRDVVARAALEARVLMSFDKDFGDLARREPIGKVAGIVLVRLPKTATRDAAAKLVAVRVSQDWSGYFSVIEPGRIRRRPLNPKLPSGGPLSKEFPCPS